MKRYILAMLALLPILFVGCQTDTTNVGYGGDDTTLTVSLSGTRTSLGSEANGKYPLYWSEGDCLAINGVESGEAQINATNPALATFAVNGGEQRPFSITYPYTSTTSKEAPVVVFPAEQSFIEGTFDKGCAPMYGYAKAGEEIALKHLAGILRFAMTAEEEVVLDRIVITSSTERLAGEFFVDCQSGTITPSDNASNSVTYTANTTLSLDNEKVFYISLPNGETGACLVEFIDSEGRKMTASWSEKSLSQGVVRKFSPITYKAETTCELKPLKVEDDNIFASNVATGYVKDSNGNPIEGVAVSDGFSVVATDSNGRYYFNISPYTSYIHITVPAEYEVPINEYGQPCFYKRYRAHTLQYDFTLTPLAGGKEKEFALFAFADPQVSKDSDLVRFQNESVPHMKSHCKEVKNSGLPCYGITLGDLIGNTGTGNREQYRDDLRDGFTTSAVGMPVFQVMGNHDFSHYNSSAPLMDHNNEPFTDGTSLAFHVAVQRNHEDIFGPANFSFDRGDVHIVGMRNIIFSDATNASSDLGFRDEQCEWLRQDLALVPKDKMVVLCVHIPIRNSSKGNSQTILSMLDEFENAHILSGHIHYTYNYEYSASSGHPNLYEHALNAVCGTWWRSNLSGGDGTPNGYGVFICKDNNFSNWYYIGCNEGMNTKGHQMRLHWGNAVTGGERPATAAATSQKGYYQFNFGEGVLVANVYNADSKWKIEVYEDGEYSGDMSLIRITTPGYETLIGDYSKENPKRLADDIEASLDMYTIGLSLGVLGSKAAYKDADGNIVTGHSGVYGACRHLYKYTLKNPKGKANFEDIEILVKATDRFNNEYTESKITEGTDYELVKKQ